MMLATNIVSRFISNFGERLSYSIKHMTIPQWGIISVIALVVGIAMMKTRR